MWVPAEKIDENIEKKPFRVDHGLLFKVQENPDKLHLYIENSEQEIPSKIKNNFRQPQPDFTINSIDYSHKNKSSEVSIEVNNNRSIGKTFRACVNIKEPIRSTKFIEKFIKDEQEVVDTIYNGGTERDEVELEIISGSQGVQNA